MKVLKLDEDICPHDKDFADYIVCKNCEHCQKLTDKAAECTYTNVKKYNLMYNIGRTKYVINFYDGISTHNDGSPFYGIYCFSNKKKLNKQISELVKEGYVYGC